MHKYIKVYCQFCIEMTGKVYLFGDIGQHDTLQPNGISDISFIAQCEKLIRSGSTSLEVLIDSNGGLVDSGNNIANYIMTCSVPVTTIVVDKAYSIASKIFLAGGIKKMKSNAKIMIHNNWIDGVKGDADQLKEIASIMAETEKKLIKEYVSATGLKEDVIDGLMKSETYIRAEEAMSLGICNEIIEENLVLAKIKTNKMSKQNTLSKLAQWAFGSLVKNQKAMLVQSTDGLSLFIDSEGGIEGKVAYIADADGMPTADVAPAGTHTLTSGETITVAEGGVISAVVEKQTDDTEKLAMKKEIEALKAKLAEKDKAFNEVKAEVASVREIAESVKKEYVQLAKTVTSNYVAPSTTTKFGRKIEYVEEVGTFDKATMKKRREQYKNNNN